MGNVTSSLNVGNPGSLANAIDEAKSDSPAILDSFHIHGLKLASFLSDTMRDTKQDPSDVLGSLLAHGRNVAASLSNTAIGASPLIANLLESFRKYWHKVLALLPISRKSLHSTFLSITINYLQRKISSLSSLLGVYCLRLLLPFYGSLEGSVGPEFVGVSPIPRNIRPIKAHTKLLGSPVSKFQSWKYGGYTPRDSIFASSTSAGMRGKTPIIYKFAAIGIASFVTIITYRSWVTK